MRFIMIIAAMLLAVPAKATDLAPWQKEAIKLMKSEQKVLGARWKDPVANVLHISMKSDGTNRNGFAQYLCMLFSDANAPKDLKTIWIYDPSSYKNGGGTQMGMAACR